MGQRRADERRRKLLSGPRVVAPPIDDPVEILVARARRMRHKGDARGTLVMLQRACALDEWRARTYTLLGVELAHQGRPDDAERALNQARWLRARAGDKARAAVTARLVAELHPVAA